MKYICIIFMVCQFAICKAQVYIIPQPTEEQKRQKNNVLSEPKKSPLYLIVYRTFFEPNYNISIGYSVNPKWEYHQEMFFTFEELQDFLSYTGRHSWNDTIWSKQVPFNEKELVAVYDLTNCKKLSCKLKSQPMVRKKEVKVQVEKIEWIDQWYEIEK